jgi:autoinducer 2-degrading protein
MKRGMALLALGLLALFVSTPSARTGDKGNQILEAAKSKVADPKKPFTMVVILTVKDGQGKALETAFAPAIKATRKEKGYIAYDLNRDVADPNKYYVYERWASIAALDAHLQTEHIKTLLSKATDLLAGPPETKFFAIVGE